MIMGPFHNINDLILTVWPRTMSLGTGLKNLTMILDHPRNRIPILPKYNWSLNKAANDLVGNLSGETLLFSEDYHDRNSVWNHIIRRLSNAYNNSEYRGYTSFMRKMDDLTTYVGLTFIINGDYLDLSVTMYYNNLYSELPYDIFCFTILQELMALELKKKLGKYKHSVDHPCITDNEKIPALNTLDAMTLDMESDTKMPSLLPPSIHIHHVQDFVKHLLKMESELKQNKINFEAALSSIVHHHIYPIPLFTAAWCWRRLMKQGSSTMNIRMIGELLREKLGNVFTYCF